MLNFFRIYDPYRLVIIFILLVVVRVVQSYFIGEIPYYGYRWLLLGEWLAEGHQLYAEAYDYTSPLSAGIYKYLHFLFGRNEIQFFVISSIVIVVQAGIFNQLLMKNKVFDVSTYIPAFLYATCMVAIPDFMTLSPQLMSLTFILLALRSVLRRINNQVNDAFFIDSGLFIGLATLLYFPNIIFLFTFFLTLLFFSTAVPRRLLLYFTSFLIVMSSCYLYYLDLSIVDLLPRFGMAGSLVFHSVEEWSVFLMENAILIAILLVTTLVTLVRASFTHFQIKVQQVILLLLLSSIIISLISKGRLSYSLVLFVPVIAYFQTRFFELIQKRLTKVFAPLIVILAPIMFTTFVTYRTAQDNLPKLLDNQGIMVIGENLDYYRKNKMLTPCFDEELSSIAFEGLDYYNSATRIYDIIIQTNPEGIYDKLGVADKLFYRFPELDEKYRKVDEQRYMRISN